MFTSSQSLQRVAVSMIGTVFAAAIALCAALPILPVA